MILHGPENVAGLARLLARAQRDAGLAAIAICHPNGEMVESEPVFATNGNSLLNVLARIAGDVDILHLYFGRSFTGDDLADGYLARTLGKPVFMTLLGCDVRDSKRLFSRGEPTMCTECWPQGCSINRQRTLDFLESSKTPPLTTTPDLALEVSNAFWLPLPIDVGFWRSDIPQRTRLGGHLRVLHAPTDEGKKGTRHVVAAVETLQQQGCAIELVLAKNVNQDELKALALTCDVAVDQLMAGVYGTFGAEMMALGLPVISRISPSLRDAYPDDLPIISAGPDTIASVLKACLDGAIDLASLVAASVSYARRIHSHHEVAKRMATLY
jgi:hypothetical protein